MSTRRDLCDALRALDPVDVPGFLTARSGLPGPRGNLELLAAFGDVAPESLILSLTGSADEYHASCAAAALDACRVTTDLLGSRPSAERRTPETRTLRQALGYCWSVAVAGSPAAGLQAFATLDGASDPDLRWIAQQNRRKNRLARLLAS